MSALRSLGIAMLVTHCAVATDFPGHVKTEFVFTSAPFKECHASTIAETKSGLVAAWFAGTREGNKDVGIWVARHMDGAWTAPAEVFVGTGVDGKRQPCWNPVLFQANPDELWLFYKVGPSPSKWWGMLSVSSDSGATWSPSKRLPDGILGPIKNKPVRLTNGDILCPTSSEHDGWRVHFERSSNNGRTWTATPPINDGKEFGAIQPSILVHSSENLQALGRTRGLGKVFSTSSADGGKTWALLASLDLPNPGSGTDAVTLQDGRHVLVYNHASRGRSPLNVAFSSDGKAWSAAAVLESDPGEYSYPAVIQTSDGRVHITYTWKRERIKHVVLQPSDVKLSAIRQGQWPG